MSRKNSIIISIIGVVLGAYACQKLMPPAPAPEQALDAPLESLTPAQQELFAAGDEAFGAVFRKSEGLGPVFVQNSCESCHVSDGKGNPFNNLTRFGRYDNQGNWDPLIEQGGPQLQHRSITNYEPEKLPDNVNTAEFLPPNVTGLGFLAAVKDETLLDLADPNDTDGDGISGEVSLIEPPDWWTPDPRYYQEQSGGKYIGRFGRKATALDLKHQTVGAYNQDMGITSPFNLTDPINHQVGKDVGDNVDDPEVSATTVNEVVFYLKTLKTPPRRNKDNPDVQAGKQIFQRIGCEECHVSTLKTGASEIEALDRVEFHPYTDLLLHDMGPELDDGYTEGSAETQEWRTMPLWGLGLQHQIQGGQIFLMHDGRARNFEEAIQLHGGEAADSRADYKKLSDKEQEQLITFLKSL